MGGAKWKALAGGIKYRDVSHGTGTVARTGSKLKVKYTGKLTNSEGTVFDHNTKGYKFTLGMGNVLQGWDFGLVGVRQNGVRELLIPAAMAYSSRGLPGKIPPHATLWFRCEISSVR